MSKSFFPHFTAVFFLHAFLLMGTWHLAQSDYVQKSLSSLGTQALKLEIATAIMRPEAVKKKVERVIPLNPTKPRTEKLVKPNPLQETATALSNGSEAGTSAQGTTEELAVFKAELRALIDRNKYYPPTSRRLGHAGTVVVAFTLLPDGHIIDVRLDTPSRYDRLNESALEAVKKVQKFKPIPKEFADGAMDIKVPVKFITI